MARKRSGNLNRIDDTTRDTMNTAADRAEDMTSSARDTASDLADSARDTYNRASNKLRSAVGNMDTQQITRQARDLYDRIPKPITPKGHAIIDYLHAGSFFVAAALFARRNRRAAVTSGLIGAGVLINALMTDYPGGVFKTYDFKVHGMMDVGVAAVSAIAPELGGFTGEPEAIFFRSEGVMETGVIAMTDYSRNYSSNAFESPYLRDAV